MQLQRALPRPHQGNHCSRGAYARRAFMAHTCHASRMRANTAIREVCIRRAHHPQWLAGFFGLPRGSDSNGVATAARNWAFMAPQARAAVSAAVAASAARTCAASRAALQVQPRLLGHACHALRLALRTLRLPSLPGRSSPQESD